MYFEAGSSVITIGKISCGAAKADLHFAGSVRKLFGDRIMQGVLPCQSVDLAGCCSAASH